MVIMLSGFMYGTGGPGFESRSNQTKWFVAPQPCSWHYYWDRARIGFLSIRIICLSGISAYVLVISEPVSKIHNYVGYNLCGCFSLKVVIFPCIFTGRITSHVPRGKKTHTTMSLQCRSLLTHLQHHCIHYCLHLCLLRILKLGLFLCVRVALAFWIATCMYWLKSERNRTTNENANT